MNHGQKSRWHQEMDKNSRPLRAKLAARDGAFFIFYFLFLQKGPSFGSGKEKVEVCFGKRVVRVLICDCGVSRGREARNK